MPTAIGTVTLLGASDTTVSREAPKRAAMLIVETMATMAPTTRPQVKGIQSFAKRRRCS